MRRICACAGIAILALWGWKMAAGSASGDVAAQSPFYEKYLKPGDSPIESVSLDWHATPIADIQNAATSNIYLAFIHIRNIPVKDIIDKITHCRTPGSTVILLPLSNEMLLVETPSCAARLLPMIESLDKAPADAKKVDH